MGWESAGRRVPPVAPPCVTSAPQIIGGGGDNQQALALPHSCPGRGSALGSAGARRREAGCGGVGRGGSRRGTSGVQMADINISALCGRLTHQLVYVYVFFSTRSLFTFKILQNMVKNKVLVAVTMLDVDQMSE